MDNQLVCGRLALLRGERKTQEERWALIERFIAPYRGMFFQDVREEQAVQTDKSEIFDGTALQSAQSLASNLHGNLTNPYVPWFAFRFRSDELNDDPEARAWLEECGDIVWLTLQASNFSREVAENYLDLTTFATTFMSLEAKDARTWKGAAFAAVPLKESFFEEDAEGGIGTFYRVLNYTPFQLVDKFGDTVPDDLKNVAEGTAAAQQKHEVVFVIYRRNRKEGMMGRKMPPKQRPWGCKYVLLRDKTTLGEESGYYEMPVFATRWSKISESKWGHGPSHVAIYDVMALNRQEMLALQALEKTIDPPQKTTERGVLGDLDLQAGGITVVRSMDDLQPMTFGTEWNVVSHERENRRMMIREYYLVSKLDLKESPAMTATEVERRWQQMQKLLGPTLGRLQADLLGPVVENTFAMLYRAGELPEPPQSVRSAAKGEMDIEYIGPLPVAQKSDIAAAIERELGLAANVAEKFGPEAMDGIDAGMAIAEHARLTAVPAKILRSQAAMKKRRDEREAQQAQAMKLQQAEIAGKAAAGAGAGAKAMAEAQQIGGAPAAEQLEGASSNGQTIQ